MNLTEIRRLIVTAMFSDEFLFERLALKGGNALELVYQIVSRGSVDIDFSMEKDFEEEASEIGERINLVLKDRFDSADLVVFDFNFRPMPPDARNPWGGYRAEFKLFDKHKLSRFARFAGDALLNEMRRQSEVVDANQHRTFKVEISKNEFCRGAAEIEFDDYTIRVYTPVMIAIEKLRAICQQMPEYTLRRKKTARARDFYDIFRIVEVEKLDLYSEANLELLRHIFAAKEVPLDLLARIQDQREFHRTDWPAVETSVIGETEAFDVYFDFVVDIAKQLQTLGVMNSPA